MSDIILISKVGLYETVKCAICENPNQTERGCDGSCQYDKELHEKIVEAVEGIAEQRPRGEWKYNPDCVNDEMQAIFYCSICNSGAYSRHDNFCPNCGADMRVKNELNRVNKELNSEIEKSKSEIVPDFRDGWRLKEGDENDTGRSN